MEEALQEACRALETADVPVGCVIVAPDQRIIGRGRNRRKADRDPTAHAEILALQEAAASLGDWRLEGCVTYVSLEPCVMCAGALVNARVARIVYGCADPKAGAVASLFTIASDPRLNHRCELTSGVCEAQAAELLRTFFRSLRAQGKK